MRVTWYQEFYEISSAQESRAADNRHIPDKITPCPVNYAVCLGKNEQ